MEDQGSHYAMDPRTDGWTPIPIYNPKFGGGCCSANGEDRDGGRECGSCFACEDSN